MTSPTISQHCRAAQTALNALSLHLEHTITLARTIGLAPFRIASIQAAIAHNKHAWNELNLVASSLELTRTEHKL